MISKEEIYEVADKYLIFNVGNLVGPGEPVFDNKINVWIVPIFHMSNVATFPLGEMIINSEGKIIHAPTTEQLEEIGEKNFQQKIKVKSL